MSLGIGHLRKSDFKPLRVVVAVVAFSVALNVVELLQGGVVGTYDSSIYFLGSAQIISGWFPYRNFLFLHPPGMLELLLPFGALSHVLGIDAAFNTSRLLILCIATANVGLIAWILRFRGRVAMLAAAAALSLSPANAVTATGVKLEPVFTLFVLCALNLVFSEKTLASTTRSRWIGIFFGCALAVKLWALIPIFILFLFLWKTDRTTVKLAGTWTAATFLISSLPFILLSPESYVRDVFWLQVTRPPFVQVAIWNRLEDLAGIYFVSSPLKTAITAFWLIFLATCSVLCLRPKPQRLLNRYAVATMWVALLVTLIPTEFFDYYSYFYAPFAALIIGIAAEAFTPRFRGLKRSWKITLKILLATALVGGVAFSTFAYRKDSEVCRNLHFPSEAVSAIRSNQCLVADHPYLLILSGRNGIKPAHCVSPLDSSALWIRYHVAPSQPSAPLINYWKEVLSNANFVELLNQNDAVVPWDYPDQQPLASWFDQHFVQVAGDQGVRLYRKRHAHS